LHRKIWIPWVRIHEESESYKPSKLAGVPYVYPYETLSVSKKVFEANKIGVPESLKRRNTSPKEESMGIAQYTPPFELLSISERVQKQ